MDPIREAATGQILLLVYSRIPTLLYYSRRTTRIEASFMLDLFFPEASFLYDRIYCYYRTAIHKSISCSKRLLYQCTHIKATPVIVVIARSTCVLTMILDCVCQMTTASNLQKLETHRAMMMIWDHSNFISCFCF